MSDTSVKGREVLLKRPPMTIFSLFSDLSLLVQNVPEEYGGTRIVYILSTRALSSVLS